MSMITTDDLILQARGYGPPEVVTCGRDGCVRVWDVRQDDAPVAAFEPADKNHARYEPASLSLSIQDWKSKSSFEYGCK